MQNITRKIVQLEFTKGINMQKDKFVHFFRIKL